MVRSISKLTSFGFFVSLWIFITGFCMPYVYLVGLHIFSGFHGFSLFLLPCFQISSVFLLMGLLQSSNSLRGLVVLYA